MNIDWDDTWRRFGSLDKPEKNKKPTMRIVLLPDK